MSEPRDDLQSTLQRTLGSSFTIERELGGGGMSRVFVATERAFQRRVVIKVLPRELMGSVSVDRFHREIQLAAALQHPHIVPVLSAGEIDELPYYVMPFVPGASLRERLADGALPMSETVSILRELAKALQFAHAQGVVHRDIKPENVLLSAGTAVVTDFGIAKAISASWHAAHEAAQPAVTTLTTAGLSIGTPQYMAPEQALGDPAIGVRADIYAFGCVAYELLSGEPPFAGMSMQRTLAAHIGETPRPVIERRPDTPPVLATLVMQCLEKEPDDRPASATDIVRALDGLGVTQPGGTLPPRRTTLARALMVYALAFVATIALVKLGALTIGLPLWTLPAAYVLMSLGLPVILFTALVHHGAARARTFATMGGAPHVRPPTLQRVAERVSPFISWRRTGAAGIAGLAFFALIVAGYLVSRAMGIGPAASLLAQGAIAQNERLIVAEFRSPANDTTLGAVLTEAFRSDLSQTDAVRVVQPTQIATALRRMQLAPTTRVDYAVARQIAQRDGIKAVIDGAVLQVGRGYIVNATLHAAANGEPITVPFRATAKSSDELIGAIESLAREVRARLGESLRSVNAARPLEEVTTGSLDALRHYTEALQLINRGVEYERRIGLLEQAVKLDTGFAMAYRKLAIELNNGDFSPSRTLDAIRHAYANRDRLTDVERQVTIGSYYTSGPEPDPFKALDAFETLIDVAPEMSIGYNNAANMLRNMRRYPRAESLATRGLAVDSLNRLLHNNLFLAQFSLGKFSEAESTIALLERHVPGAYDVAYHRGTLDWQRHDFASALRRAHVLRKERPNENNLLSQSAFFAASAEATMGQMRAAWATIATKRAADMAIGNAAGPLADAAFLAQLDAIVLERNARGAARLDSAIAATPLSSMPSSEPPYLALVQGYAYSGRPDRARAIMAAFETARREAPRNSDRSDRPAMQGEIALADGRYADAVRLFREADVGPCPACFLPWIARSYDLGGNADSAIALFQRYVAIPDPERFNIDPIFLAGAYKRLGELLEARGDREGALRNYGTFVTMWKDADPELQPKVAAVRASMARLQAQERR